MKLAVFDDLKVGVVDGASLIDITPLLPAALDLWPAGRMNWLIANWQEMRPTILEGLRHGTRRSVAEVTLLPPVPAAPHVFAAPSNYQKHIGELGDRGVTKKGRSAREQGFFLKAPGSLIGAGGAVLLPRGSERRFDHESELAVIVGRAGRNIARADAMNYVFGYSCLIDATMRIEAGAAEEERSMRKSFATFTPCGPYLVTADEVENPEILSNRLWVNDELRQEANTRDMIVGIAELIELVSSVLPISPGDIIATGTPEGVGPLAPGDTVRIAIEGVGDMTLPVREAEVRSPRAY